MSRPVAEGVAFETGVTFDADRQDLAQAGCAPNAVGTNDPASADARYVVVGHDYFSWLGPPGRHDAGLYSVDRAGGGHPADEHGAWEISKEFQRFDR